MSPSSKVCSWGRKARIINNALDADREKGGEHILKSLKTIILPGSALLNKICILGFRYSYSFFFLFNQKTSHNLTSSKTALRLWDVCKIHWDLGKTDKRDYLVKYYIETKAMTLVLNTLLPKIKGGWGLWNKFIECL